jgi:hypothetical protein
MARITKQKLKAITGFSLSKVRERLKTFGFKTDETDHDEEEINAIFFPGLKLLADGASSDVVSAWAAKRRSDLMGESPKEEEEEIQFESDVTSLVEGMLAENPQIIARGVARGIQKSMKHPDFFKEVRLELFSKARTRAVERLYGEKEVTNGSTRPMLSSGEITQEEEEEEDDDDDDDDRDYQLGDDVQEGGSPQ